jgi:hypothetical protein
MRLLARDREQRYPSAAVVLEALSAKAPPPAAKTVAEAALVPAPVPDPTPQRSRSSVWVIAAILIAICLGVWAGLQYLPPLLATAVPVLTPSGGAYPEAKAVTISDTTPFSTIHYTVDGSTPTEASSIYTQPISLPNGGVVRAMATTVWGRASSEASGTYTWSVAKLSAGKPPEPSEYELGKAAFDKNDYAQARTLFTKACDGNELNACNYLGFIYANGLGIEPDAKMAQEIYQKSCDGGRPRGCIGLGSVYQNSGKNTDARKYFKQVCGESQDATAKAEACELLRGVQ